LKKEKGIHWGACLRLLRGGARIAASTRGREEQRAFSRKDQTKKGKKERRYPLRITALVGKGVLLRPDRRRG